MKKLEQVQKELNEQKAKLWLANSRYNTAVKNRNELDTPEAYKEVADALKEWGKQDKLMTETALRIQYSHKLVFKG